LGRQDTGLQQQAGMKKGPSSGQGRE